MQGLFWFGKWDSKQTTKATYTLALRIVSLPQPFLAKINILVKRKEKFIYFSEHWPWAMGYPSWEIRMHSKGQTHDPKAWWRWRWGIVRWRGMGDKEHGPTPRECMWPHLSKLLILFCSYLWSPCARERTCEKYKKCLCFLKNNSKKAPPKFISPYEREGAKPLPLNKKPGQWCLHKVPRDGGRGFGRW